MIKHNLKNKLILITILLGLCLITMSTVSATDIHMNTTNNTIANAVENDANDGDTIILDEGTYNYTHINNANGITINKNLTIIGQGADKTIIDAEKQGRIFYIPYIGTLTLINLTLINGYTSEEGGAIKNVGGTVTINGCTLNNNTANNFIYDGGGAIYNEGVNFTIANSTFKNNTANTWIYGGGAIYNEGVNFTIANSTFNKNTAKSGGAIYNRGVNFTVSNSTFNNNIALNGGGIWVDGNNVKIIGSKFDNNIGSDSAGAIHIYNIINGTFINCTFINNTAGEYGGGAIRFENSEKITIKGCDFINNNNTIIINQNNKNNTINYNRFVNNTGYDITNSGTNTSVDFNWWGTNNPDMSKFIGITLNNYYNMNINVTDSDWTVGDNLNLLYNFVLNGTQDNTGADLLPYFDTIFYYNGNEVNVTDARISQTLLIPLTTAILDNNITAITDNQNETIQLNVSKGETKTTLDNGSTETNKTIDLTAKITDKNGKPLSGKTVKFYANGEYIGEVITGIDGVAILAYTPTLTGNYTVNAVFEEDDDYLNSSFDSLLTVIDSTPEPPTPTPEPPNPEPVNPDDPTPIIEDNKETINNPTTASASMEKTGIPINIILIILCSVLVVLIGRKQN